MSDMNLPFEACEPREANEPLAYCGGVVVLSAQIITGAGMQAALIFRFARADGGGFLPPICLLADDLDGLPPLLQQAVDRALGRS